MKTPRKQTEQALDGGTFFDPAAFEDLARRVFSVTPDEMKEREAEWAAEQAKKGKRGPKPKGGG